MSQAHDALVLINDSSFIHIKRFLRLISDDDVVIIFSDDSELIFKRTESWRRDRLEVKNET